MNARTRAHLLAAYTEHVRALHAHLGITAAVAAGDIIRSDEILPGPPMEYALRARLESGLVIDAHERVQWASERSTAAAAWWSSELAAAPAVWKYGLFAPRCEDRPGHWCVEVKRWVPVASNDSLADRTARAAGIPTFPVEIRMQLQELSSLKSQDRSPLGLVSTAITGLKIAAAAA